MAMAQRLSQIALPPHLNKTSHFYFQVPDDTASPVNSRYKLWIVHVCQIRIMLLFSWIATWRPPVWFATCFHPPINTPLWHPRGRNRCQVQSKTFCSLCCIPSNFSWDTLRKSPCCFGGDGKCKLYTLWDVKAGNSYCPRLSMCPESKRNRSSPVTSLKLNLED